MPPKKQQAAKAAPKKEAAKKKEEQLPERTKEDPKGNPRDVATEAPKIVTKAKDEAHPKSQPEAEPKKANGTGTTPSSKKRKAAPTKEAQSVPSKAPRQGSRSSSRTTAQATPKQLLNYLLSSSSLPHCYPPDELDFARQNPNLKSYSLTSPSQFTPWENLICAHLLSKPLSHVLGMRSIRTLLNPPYSFNTPEACLKAGEAKIYESLEAARTQHRQKTAAYIYQMAQRYTDEKEDAMYHLSVKANDDGPQGVVNYIKSTIKGMGNVGAELFTRRIQCVDGWGDAVWPFADSKCIDSLREIGVGVRDAEELQEGIERDVDWDEVGDMGLNEVKEGVGTEMEIQVQVELVVALERAVGCALEGHVDELRRAALG